MRVRVRVRVPSRKKELAHARIHTGRQTDIDGRTDRLTDRPAEIQAGRKAEDLGLNRGQVNL